MFPVYSLEHAEFEDPGYITKWLSEHQLSVIHIRLFKGDPLPDPRAVGLLLVMGGPMNIYEEEIYPWLPLEKTFIRHVLDLDIPVLGICLGGQLIADQLGGTVTKAPQPEYGWYTITQNAAFHEKSNNQVLQIPETIEVFQWHEDTFSIPPGCVHLYSSDSCLNQAFLYNDRVIGLQFHPEMHKASIQGFLKYACNEIKEKELVHIQEDIEHRIHLCSQGHKFINIIMKYLLSFSLLYIHTSQGEPTQYHKYY